jgi:hypothetical protein
VKINFKKVLPKDPSFFNGFRFVRIFTAVFMIVVSVRSCIHLFKADGGAHSIAGVDVDVPGGDNIIAMFHQWGAIQLILAALLIVLFVRYPGLTPLVLLALASDPVMRAISGHIKHITTVGTPPGAMLNWPVFYILVILFATSLIETKA